MEQLTTELRYALMADVISFFVNNLIDEADNYNGIVDNKKKYLAKTGLPIFVHVRLPHPRLYVDNTRTL